MDTLGSVSTTSVCTTSIDASSISDRGVKRSIDELMTEIELLAEEGRLPSWRLNIARDLYRFTCNVLQETLR